MQATPVKLTRKEQILAIATSLFREKGYNASSMRNLAEIIGIEASSLYNHISSKDELLRDICFSVAEVFIQQLDELEKKTLSEIEKVEQIIRFHIKMMIDQFERVYVSNRDWKHLKEPHLTAYVNERRNYEKRFSAIIDRGISNNHFSNRNTYITVLTIMSAVRSIEFWHKNKRNIGAQQLENDMTGMLMEGLVSR